MKIRALVTLALGGALIFAAAGGAQAVAPAATTTVQLEAQPCVITLDSSYVTNQAGNNISYSGAVSTSVLVCPFGVPDLADVTFHAPVGDSGSVQFTSPSGSSSFLFFDTRCNSYNAGTAVITGRDCNLLQAVVDTYNAVLEVDGVPSYLAVTSTGLNYKIVLAKPFTVSEGLTPKTCTFSPKKRLVMTYSAYGVKLPDSSIKCDGFTYNSTNYSANATFESSKGEIYDLTLATNDNSTASAAGTTLVTTPQLSFSYGGLGKYSSISNDGYVTNMETYERFQLVLGNSFKMKYATDVSALANRIDDQTIAISMHADRNQDLGDPSDPSYKRQTVLPNRKADHALVYRDGKKIATVKLTNFGDAVINVEDKKGGKTSTYEVKMRKCVTNYAGSASFKK